MGKSLCFHGLYTRKGPLKNKDKRIIADGTPVNDNAFIYFHKMRRSK